MASAKLAPELKPVSWASLLAALPAPRRPDRARDRIARTFLERDTRLFVIDDDPTGSQAVRDVRVLTRWDEEDLRRALRGDGPPVTFVLTNSRSLDRTHARRVNATIGARAARLATDAGVDVQIVSRGDSTLRGHFQAETDALIEGWQGAGGPRIDGVVFCPAFLDAGRITVSDVHWVHAGEEAVPVGRTEFAQDETFGYRSSHLLDWLAEQDARGRGATSISLDDIRVGGVEHVTRLLHEVRDGQVVIANAADDADLDVLVLSLLDAEVSGKRFIYRTGPSFVAARCGQAAAATLRAGEVYEQRRGGNGLIVVGSHVEVTSRQLAKARLMFDLAEVEIDVAALLSDERDAEIARATARASEALEQRHVVISTSREVHTGCTPWQTLAFSREVSAALVKVVHAIAKERPLRFLLAKGGITAAEIVTRALGVRSATVLGQLLPGQVSVWRLDKHAGLPFVVFPGNVGSDEGLADALAVLVEAPR